MPLTLAHPAAILPLRRALGRHAVGSALAVGSMAPDFAYFWPGVPIDSHTPWALLWFAVPAGWLGYGLWHGLLARPLWDLVPPKLAPWLRPLFHPNGRLPATSATVVTLALLLGAATHLVWDAFTHGHGAAVRAWPLLQTELGHVGGYALPVFRVAQHGSTLAGLAVLVWWLRRARPTPAVADDASMSSGGLPPGQRWLHGAALVGVPVGLGVVWARAQAAGSTLQVQVGTAVFAALPIGALTLLGWAAWRTARRRGR